MYELYKSVDVAERIRIIAKEKNISLNTMFSDIGLGKNTLMNFKTSMPKADNLAKIADYLEVSTDYLLGRTDNSQVFGDVKTGDNTATNGAINNVSGHSNDIHNNLSNNPFGSLPGVAQAFSSLPPEQQMEVGIDIINRAKKKQN